MMAEWAIPAITGVVGLAGIAATYYTALTHRRTQLDILRRQHSSHLRDALRNERKALYLAFTRNAHYAVDVSKAIAARTSGTPGEADLEQLDDLHRKIQVAWLEAKLISETETCALLDQAYELVHETIRQAARGEPVRIDHVKARSLQENMLAAMRTELQTGSVRASGLTQT